MQEARRQKGLAAINVPSVYRETEEAIAAARSKGILAVEMEAAALYAFARAPNNNILCLAHVTNTMAVAEQDFEKGEADRTVDALLYERQSLAGFNRNVCFWYKAGMPHWPRR